METATFGAGCFWGVEALFRRLKGVHNTAVGYSGGHTSQPTYEQVCTDRTGHAEVVRVEFDPAEISYEQLLETFFANHDPTTRNRQGPDWGSQYRSVVFYHSEAQRAAAEAVRQRLDASGTLQRPIVTEIEPAAEFHLAEDYHQQYLEKRGRASCHL
jgi:peptide-methionine (S)-S-oxide reductase